MFRARLQAWVLTLLVIGANGGLRGAEHVTADRRLPAKTVFYVDLGSVEQLKQKWGETLWAKLVQSEAMGPMRTQFREPLIELSDKVREKTGLTLEELLSIPQGEVAASAMLTTDNKAAYSLFLDYGDRRTQLDSLLEKVAESMKADGAVRSEVEHEGTSIVLYEQKAGEKEEASEEDEEDPEEPQTVAYFLKDTTLVIGSSADPLKEILTRWDGSSEKTLANEPVYQYIQKRCHVAEQDGTPTIRWYFDPVAALQSAVLGAGPPNPQSAMILGSITNLGVDQLKGIGGTVDLGTPEYDSISRTMIYAETPAKGVLQIFQFPGTDLAPPPWVSQQSSTYFGMNWDVEQAYAGVTQIFDTFSGDGALAKFVDEFAEQEDGPKIHIKKDVLDQLAGPIHLMGDLKNSEDVDSERFVFAFEVKDEAKLQKTLEALAALPGVPLKSREFEGAKLYEMPAEDGEQAGLAVARKSLLLSTDVTLLEGILRSGSDQESLADSANYKAVAKHFGKQVSAIGFQRKDVQLRTLYQMLKTGESIELFSTKVDFSKLPAFEAMEPFLSPSGSMMQPDEHGLFWSSFSLQKAE